MKRREFITLLSGAAVGWPLAARAQQPAVTVMPPTGGVRRIGVLMGQADGDPVAQARLAAFRQALQALGWSEGRNVRFENRWSGGDIGLVRAYAAELVGLQPDIILAAGTPVIAALKQATRSVPLVFVIVNDPVAQGFVSSVAHPGENITGFSYMDYSVVGKGMELLTRAAPGVTRVGFMFNPDTYPYYDVYLRFLLAAPLGFPLEVMPARVRSEAEIEAAITKIAEAPAGGLVVPPEPFTFTHRKLIIDLAAQNSAACGLGNTGPGR